MSFGHKIKKGILSKIGVPQIENIIDFENSLSEKENAIRFTSNSPTRFEIPLEAIKYMEKGGDTTFFQLRVLPLIFGSMIGIKKGLSDLRKNPVSPKLLIDPGSLEHLEKNCKSLNVGMIGYAKLPSDLIFKDKAIMYENAIVLVMEMNKKKLDSSPSQTSFIEVHRTYRDLGFITNKVADYLRKKGYGAHPIHPLGGAVLMPPLAMLAGLGWQGRHGLLITPDFGPRVRIAAVFTCIQNLPFKTENTHNWIENWCQKCGRCIRKCPPSAILEKKIEKPGEILTCIDVNKCFPYFMENNGCSVCIKECEFNISGYEKLKQRIMSKKEIS